MSPGLLATVVTIVLTFVAGILTAVGLIVWLWKWKRVQTKAFPFIDEILLSTEDFNHELNHNVELTVARSIRQGLWLIAYAIVTGMTVSGLLNLMGHSPPQPDSPMTLSSILLAITLAVSPCDAPGADPAYTQAARRAAAVYWAPQRRYLWCALVAQAGAESGWQADAVSPVGAEGPWQVMRPTWLMWMQRRGWQGSPFDPWLSAQVAAVHMEMLAGFWSAPRSDWCRIGLQIASYNAGQGNILKAQVLSGGASCWDDIAPYLKDVTGRHAEETLAYVERWRRILLQLWELDDVPPELEGPEETQ